MPLTGHRRALVKGYAVVGGAEAARREMNFAGIISYGADGDILQTLFRAGHDACRRPFFVRADRE